MAGANRGTDMSTAGAIQSGVSREVVRTTPQTCTEYGVV